LNSLRSSLKRRRIPAAEAAAEASLLDIDLPGVDRNLVRVGASPWLYYTRLNAANDRDLVRQRLTATSAV